MKSKRKEAQLGGVNDELFLQPWFVPKSVSLQLRKLLQMFLNILCKVFINTYLALSAVQQKTPKL